jgi:hypothetical protein
MMKLSFVLVLCITGIASAVGEPVCLVINPTDAGIRQLGRYAGLRNRDLL